MWLSELTPVRPDLETVFLELTSGEALGRGRERPVMRLLALELTRLRWRRAVVVLLAGCALITVVVFAGTAWTTRPVSDADLRHAQAQVDRELARALLRSARSSAARTRPDRYGVGRRRAVRRAMMGPAGRVVPLRDPSCGSARPSAAPGSA